ncbi:hypothetical protein EB796_012367 [Bugula neritina]|uniref:Uncharacterized protein n=2 Tax=Bugula neritina TaxID=10212 RepID=A0A7J7JTU2_BUGNE|nr:hypothetical protein EB796_012367 [Bugula neritina]
MKVISLKELTTLDSNILLWGDEGWAGTVSSKFLLVGLTDGRVLFMDPFVRGLLHVDFRANKDAIRDIRHGKDTQQLLIQCDRNEVAIVQIFGLPTLQLQHELCLFQDIVTCTRMGDTVFYGYSDGAVSFHNLEEIDEDNINRRTNQIKNITELKQSQLVQKKFEHKDAIRSVDCCPRKRLFLSCGCDSVIKIWSVRDQCVIADVTLDNTLSCACFLNSTGDLVFGFLNNLYSISLNSLLPDLEEYGVSTYAESITAESDVYEDPAVTSEGVLPNLEPLDLSNYLKPYELDITKDFLEATDIVVRPQTREKEEEESEIMSNAPTDAYISDVSTPRLSRMDVFTPQSIQWDQLSSDSGHAQIMTKSEADVASPDVDKQLQFDRLDVTNPKHAEHFFPLFGDSPGGTPSVSSAETLSNSRSDLDDLSDFEFGTEYGSDNDDQPKVAAKKLSKQTKTVKSQQTNKQVLAKKKKVKKSELVLSFAPDDLSVPELVTKSALSSTKYGIDKMKIDVDALLKQGKKKKKVTVNVELSAPVEKESMEEKLANLQLRQSLQAGASELSSKKKKAASSRKRVPAASKKSSSSVKRTERDVQPVSQSSKASPSVTQQSVKKEKVNTVSGDIVSGLVPVALPTPPLPTSVPPKKNVAARTQRKGQIIDAKAPEYPSDMVKVPINENDRNPTQADEHEDDVDLSRYMDIDDDMECKSAASWNMATPDAGAKDSPGRSKTPSNLIQGPRVSSAQPERTKNRSSGMGSADSRIRVSVGLRTPLWSERMSDIDALSIQMDAYDDIVEGRVTPQPSVSESAADESTTRSGMSPIRLPNLLPDLDEDIGIPSRSDALSLWLMGSMPRAGSVADSEIPTRPSTRPGRKKRSIHVTIDDGSTISGVETEARPNSAVTELTYSPMLGHRNNRPHTAPAPFTSSFHVG